MNIRESMNPLTEEQKAFFANSKVRNNSGELLVVYHGTGTTIKSFSPEFTGMGNDQYGSGFYFTDNYDTAHGYTQNRLKGNDGTELGKPGGEDNPNVIAAYINLENPIIVDGAENSNLGHIFISEDAAFAIMKHLPSMYLPPDSDLDGETNPLGDYLEEYWDLPDKQPLSTQKCHSMIKKVASQYYDDTDIVRLENLFLDYPTEFRAAVCEVLGYDGVIVNFSDSRHIIAWFPEQIKSVDNLYPKHSIWIED